MTKHFQQLRWISFIPLISIIFWLPGWTLNSQLRNYRDAKNDLDKLARYILKHIRALEVEEALSKNGFAEA